MKYKGKNHVMIYGNHSMLNASLYYKYMHIPKYESRIMVNKSFLLVLHSPDFRQKSVQH
jgi:calcineurin-like phosphoesterase family protein